MKTKTNIEAEIKSIEVFISDNLRDLTSAKIKKEKKRIEYLKGMCFYLETNPSEDYLKSEKKRLSSLIDSKKGQYLYWRDHHAPKNVDPKKWPSIFNKELGVNQFKKQLKTIEFLLS